MSEIIDLHAGYWRFPPTVQMLDDDDGAVLLDSATGRFWRLNPSAATALGALSDGGTASETAMTRQLATTYRAQDRRCAHDVRVLVDELSVAELIEPVRSRPAAISAAVRSDAAAAAELLATRLADPDLVSAALASSARRTDVPLMWHEYSLYTGSTGLAVLFNHAAAALPDRRDEWHEAELRELGRAVVTTQAEPIGSAGMAAGLSGLATAVRIAARDDDRYADALASVEDKLTAFVAASAGPFERAGLADDDYDLITGDAGVLVALADTADGRAGPTTLGVAGRLTDLVVPADGTQRCRIHPHRYPLASYRTSYPYGYVNLGLAHGVPGVLGALALAAPRLGGSLDLTPALRQVANYVVDAGTPRDGGLWWPAGIPLDPHGDEARPGQEHSRSAWCYGTVGVALTLLNAAAALDDTELRDTAAASIDASLDAARPDQDTWSPTFCHGLAGLLAICVRAAREPGADRLHRHVPALVEAILAGVDESLPLGVRDQQQPGVWLDDPSLLNGAAGIALALWTAAEAVPTAWERPFLLS